MVTVDQLHVGQLVRIANFRQDPDPTFSVIRNNPDYVKYIGHTARVICIRSALLKLCLPVELSLDTEIWPPHWLEPVSTLRELIGRYRC